MLSPAHKTYPELSIAICSEKHHSHGYESSKKYI